MSRRIIGLRVWLISFWLMISLFGRIVSSWSTVRMRVVRRPISWTLPKVPGDGDVVADPERPVPEDGQPGDQVRQAVLGGEPEGEAEDADAGQQRGDVDAELARRHHQAQAQDDVPHQPAGDLLRRRVGPGAAHDPPQDALEQPG